MVYIALLRGINVSGHNKIKMANLRAVLEQQLQKVRTYIQSGNIAFESTHSLTKSKEIIGLAIKKEFDLDVPVLVFEQSYFTKVIEQNPFLSIQDIDTKKLYITFLSEKPIPTNVAILQEKYKGDDEFKIQKDVLYLYYKNGAGKTKLTNKFIENHLKVTATSRNWRTTQKLAIL